MLLKAGSLRGIAVASCTINVYAPLLQNDRWRLGAVLNRQNLVIVVGFRHDFIMFGFVLCCSQLSDDVRVQRLELSSGLVVLLKGITGCLAHLCAEQLKPLSHNVFDFGRAR